MKNLTGSHKVSVVINLLSLLFFFTPFVVLTGHVGTDNTVILWGFEMVFGTSKFDGVNIIMILVFAFIVGSLVMSYLSQTSKLLAFLAGGLSCASAVLLFMVCVFVRCGMEVSASSWTATVHFGSMTVAGLQVIATMSSLVSCFEK